MSFHEINNQVGISDILPDRFAALARPGSVLSLDDIIFPNDNHELVPGNDLSYEYRFCLPINIIKVIDHQVQGIRVTLTNTGEDLDRRFTFIINFFDDLYGKQDVGEEDFEELKRLVTNDRVIFNEYGINTSYQHPSSREFITNTQGRASNMSPHQLMGVIGATIGSNTLEDIIGESVSSGFVVPGLRAAGYGNDPNLKEAISITDNSNIMGDSLKHIRDTIAENIRSGFPSYGTFQSVIVNTLEEHNDNTPESIALGSYQTYNSPVFLSKRKIRLSKSKLDPSRDMFMLVKPIVRSYGNQRNTGRTSVFNRMNMQGQLADMIRPRYSPDIRVVSECRGYAKILLTKREPTIRNVKVHVVSRNLVTQENIYAQPISVVMNEMSKTVELVDIPNVYPIKTKVVVVVEDNTGVDTCVASTKSIFLKTYENSVPLIMPNHLEYRDTTTITALSQDNSVLIRIGDLPDGFLYGHLMREDMSVPVQKRPPKHVVGIVGNNRENSAGEYELTDTKVSNNRVYRYFLEYKVAMPVMPALVGIPLRGQERTCYEKRISARDATVRFKRSLTNHNVVLGQPTFSSNRAATRYGVRMEMTIQGEPGHITFRDMKAILGSDRVDVRNDFGKDERAMKTRLNIALVERMDRVTGDEEFVGLALLQSNVKTQFLDATFFKDKTTGVSLGGKYTYKIKLSRPTVGALQGLKVPLKNPRFGGSPLEANQTKIDALKMTSEIFTKAGRLQDTETLSNGTYLDIIKSFDTGCRFYVDFNPPPVSPTVARLEGKVEKVAGGQRLTWTISQAQSNAIRTFLIYKAGQSGTRRLLGARLCVPGTRVYTYVNNESFQLPSGIGSVFSDFYIIPVTHQGDLLGQVTISMSAFERGGSGGIEAQVLNNPLIFHEANEGSVASAGIGANVFREANQRLGKFSDK